MNNQLTLEMSIEREREQEGYITQERKISYQRDIEITNARNDRERCCPPTKNILIDRCASILI